MRCAASLLLALVLAIPAAAATGPVDWNALADAESVEIQTRREDGGTRETDVRLVVWRGEGYVRGRGGPWLRDVERNPDVEVRVDGEVHPLRARPVKDSETWEAVSAAFREKYGWPHALLDFVRHLGSVPTILRLEPRTRLAPR